MNVQSSLNLETYSRRESPVPTPKQDFVIESDYWENYYENGDISYEWNNGYLEEKPVSDYLTYLMYQWFVNLLDYYLYENPKAQFTGLEMGFRLSLPHKTTIRKPDLGVVCHDNPIPLRLNDRSYQGIFDLCIEALSDSTVSERKRDTIIKKGEYATAGVREYYILYGHEGYTEFYRLNPSGIYVPIPRINGEVIQSTVLPGFQFRISDLHQRPSPDDMINDPIYQAFVLPGYRKAKNLILEMEKAEQQVKQAQQTANIEKIARQKAEQRTQQAEAEIARLKTLLASKK